MAKVLRVRQTIKGKRIYNIGEKFAEGSPEYGALSKEGPDMVEIITPAPVHPASVPPPVDSAEDTADEPDEPANDKAKAKAKKK
jgi:hypothetical protein